MDESSRTHNHPSNGRARHRAVVDALASTLSEFHWNHPRLRVCCGVFGAGERMCVLEVRETEELRPLKQFHAEGNAVREYRDALDAHRAGLFVADLDEDDILGDVPRSILGEDTRATHVIPLRSGDETIGFVRMDAVDAADIEPKVVDALEWTVPTTLVAAAFEREFAVAQVTAKLLARLEEEAAERRALFSRAASQLRGSLGTLSAEEALERLLVLLDTMAESDETDASSFRTNPILISKMAPPCTPPVSKAH